MTVLVASGPLDESADAGTIPAVPQVKEAVDVVGARGEVTFGGFLAADAKGFPASAMAKNNAGDWRNPERIRAWVAEVHEELTGAARNAHSASPARTQNTRDYPPPHSVVPP